MQPLWVIRLNCADPDAEPLWWSNEDGWVDARTADVFTEYEHRRLRLPAGGVWERVS